MASQLHVLKAILQSDISGFVGRLEAAAKSTEGLGRKWAEAGQAIASSAQRITVAVGTVATGIAGSVAKIGFSFNAMQESSTIAFSTLLGDGEKAKKFMGELRDFAAKTPFELPGLVDAAQKMLAFGFAAEEILPTLTAVGDAAAGLGGSPALLEQMTRALGQIKAKGKVSAEEMLQLAEAGVPAWQFLADFLKTDVANAMSQVTAGSVSSAQGIEAIVGGMQQKFGGLMAQQSQTFSGLLSTIKDTMNQAAGEVMQPAFERIRESMKGLVNSFDSEDFRNAITRLGSRVEDVVRKISDSFGNLKAGDTIRQLENAIGGAVDIFGKLVVAARQVGPPLLEFGKAVSSILGSVLNLVASNPMLLEFFAMWKVASILGIAGAVTKLGAALVTAFVSYSSAVATATVATTASTAAWVGQANAALSASAAARTAAFSMTATGTAATGALPSLLAVLGPVGIFATAAAFIWGTTRALKAYREEQARIEKMEFLKQQKADAEQGTADFRGRLADMESGNALSQLADGIAAARDKMAKFQNVADNSEKAIANEQDPSIKDALSLSAQVHRDLAKEAAKQLDSAIVSFTSEAQERFRKAIEGSNLPGEIQSTYQKQFDEAFRGFQRAETGPKEFVQEISKMVASIGQQAKEIAKERAIMEAPARKRTAERERLFATQEAIAKQKTEQRQQTAGPEFDRVSKLLQQPDMTDKAVKAVAQSIEGITPALIDELMKDFQVMREAGQLTKDNIEYSVLTVLESLKKTEEESKKAKDESEIVKQELASFREDIANEDLTKTGSGAKVDSLDKASASATTLESLYNDGAISLDIFRQRLAQLRQELDVGIAKANQAIATEQKIDSTVGKALDGFNARIEQFATRLPIHQIDRFKEVAQKLGETFEAGKITIEKFKVKLQQMLQSAAEGAGPAGKAAGKFFGGGGGSGGGFTPQWRDAGAFWDLGKQIHEFFGATVQDAANGFRDTVENIDVLSPMQRIYEDLMALPQPFSSVSGHTDSIEASGGSGQSITVSLPNITKISNAEARQLVSMIQDEMQRRGRSAF